MPFPTNGFPSAKLWLLGDAPYGDDVVRRRPFATSSAQILPLMLHRSGITFNGCYSQYLWDSPFPVRNNVHIMEGDILVSTKKRGEEEGLAFVDGYYVGQEVLEIRERILRELDSQTPGPITILTLGELPLWIVTGQKNIHTCRGSIYESLPTPSGKKFKVVCTYSVQDLTRQQDLKPIFERDVERAALELSRGPAINFPKWDFLVQGTFDEYVARFRWLVSRLDREPLYLSCDIETIRHEIACIGLAWSNRAALCLPLRTSGEYWTPDQELELLSALRLVLEHRNARIVGQNFLYDSQYIGAKWGIVPRLADDTMDMQHVLFPGIPKALHFLASVYCDFYQYWKDELDDYKSAPKDDNLFFSYNCRDCCYTLESRGALQELLKSTGRHDLYRKRMQESFWTILRMTLRGAPVNKAMRSKLATDLIAAGMERETFLNEAIGRPFNPRSTQQMKEFFYDEMKVKPERARTGNKNFSLGAEILVKIPDTYPLLAPICDAIIEMRSIGTFLRTFIQSELDGDGRVRSMFKLSGPETFRLASSENAFGRGMNLQNLPKGDRAKTSFKMPNIREMFLPEPGTEIFDIDLAGADAQVVAWTSGDPTMKALFRAKIKIAAFAAKELYGGAAGPDGKAEPYYTRAKMGGHLSNYYGQPPTMAKALGITVHEADKFQKRWFEMFPGITTWHERVRRNLEEKREVTNAFGFKKTFFGRIDKALPEALAWEPQSAVAVVTLRAMDILDREFDPMLRILIQVHDSIVFTLPIYRPPELLENVLDAARIVIPFDDPLVIPFGVASSTVNWGKCKD